MISPSMCSSSSLFLLLLPLLLLLLLPFSFFFSFFSFFFLFFCFFFFISFATGFQIHMACSMQKMAEGKLEVNLLDQDEIGDDLIGHTSIPVCIIFLFRHY